MRFNRLADWLQWQQDLHPSAIDLGLGRVRRTLERLEWRRPPVPIITVGGTNGKGSCVALLESIAAAGGYRVGTFTSPHLTRYNERIRVAGAEIPDGPLVEAFARIDSARRGETLTFFEFNTLAALLVFERARLDLIVLEVGLGGRLDAVNVVDADASLLVSVAIDHTDWLGPDRESIGREKAGIFRGGCPAVLGSADMPASVYAVAAELGADLRVPGRHFGHRQVSAGWSWWCGSRQEDGLPAPALAGAAQFANAAAVLTTLDCLRERIPVARTAIDAGLSNVRLPGRLQRVSGPIEWIFDVAHNPAAAITLADALRGWPCAGRTLAVCGILADKDVEGIVAALSGIVDEWVIAALSGDRAAPADALVERIRLAGAARVAPGGDVAAACSFAATVARSGDRIVVFGSFLTVGPALDAVAALRTDQVESAVALAAS